MEGATEGMSSATGLHINVCGIKCSHHLLQLGICCGDTQMEVDHHVLSRTKGIGGSCSLSIGVLSEFGDSQT